MTLKKKKKKKIPANIETNFKIWYPSYCPMCNTQPVSFWITTKCRQGSPLSLCPNFLYTRHFHQQTNLNSWSCSHESFEEILNPRPPAMKWGCHKSSTEHNYMSKYKLMRRESSVYKIKVWLDVRRGFELCFLFFNFAVLLKQIW